MTVPTNFGVDVRTPEPLTLKFDVSERTMFLALTITFFVPLAIKKLKN